MLDPTSLGDYFGTHIFHRQLRSIFQSLRWLTRHKNLRVIWGLIISSQENTQKNKATNEDTFSWPLNVSSQSLCDVTTSVERNVLNISKLIRGFAAWIIVWLSCRKGCLAFKIPL